MRYNATANTKFVNQKWEAYVTSHEISFKSSYYVKD